MPMGTVTSNVLLMVICAPVDAGTDGGGGDSGVMDSGSGIMDTGSPVDSTVPQDAGDGGATGTGADGVLNVTSGQTFNLGMNTVGAGGRTVADGIAYAVTSNPAVNSTTVTATAALAGIGGGDTVMIITLQDTAATAGTYELAQVASVAGSTATLKTPLHNSYHGTVELLRVPSYQSVTIQMGGTLTAPVFGGGTGGVLALTSTGAVEVAGTIQASELGFAGGTTLAGPQYAGGTLPTASSGFAGGSFVCGSAFAPGGGGITQVGFDNSCPPSGEQSGMGGAGQTNLQGYSNGSSGGAGGTGDLGSGALGGQGYGAGGGGGGGSCNGTSNDGNGGVGGNGGTGVTAGLGGQGGGGGGGGGAPGCGKGTGAAGGSGGNGQNSAMNGAVMNNALLQIGAGSGLGGGGGGGGAANGTPGFAGTGGGPGGASYTKPTAGGPSGVLMSTSARGGGVIYIAAPSVTVTGTITANGGPGGGGNGGGGGQPGDCGGSGAGGGGGGGAGGNPMDHRTSKGAIHGHSTG